MALDSGEARKVAAGASYGSKQNGALSGVRHDPEPTAKTCGSCGTEIPRREGFCAICRRVTEAKTHRGMETLVHWMVFLATMAVILGVGYALSP